MPNATDMLIVILLIYATPSTKGLLIIWRAKVKGHAHSMLIF